MKRSLLAITLSAVLLSPIAVADDAKQRFEQAYAAMQQGLQNKPDSASLTKLVEQAYLASSDYFGVDHINTANLQISYLNSLSLHQLQQPASRDIANRIMATYEKRVGADDPAMLDILLLVLSTHQPQVRGDEVEAAYDRLMALANSLQQQQLDPSISKLQIDAAAQLIRIGHPRAKQLPDLTASLTEQYGAEHGLTLLAKFQEGRYFEALGEKQKASERFAKVAELPLPKTPKYLVSPKYMSHARLVNFYAEQGDDAQATEHCLAISSMGFGIDDAREPQPLYRVSPKYPKFQMERGDEDEVLLTYDISATGTVTNIRVEKSRHQAFAKAAEEAVAQWRFAPRMEAGKAVASADRQVIIDFSLDW